MTMITMYPSGIKFYSIQQRLCEREISDNYIQHETFNLAIYITVGFRTKTS